MACAIRCKALVVLAVGSTGIVWSASSAQAPGGSAVDLELACQSQGDEVELKVTLRNVGVADTAVALGSVLANGTKYLADNLGLDVRTASGITRYRFSDPSVPGVAGRIDTWVVPLPVASEYTMTLPLTHFWSSGEQLASFVRPFSARPVLSAAVPRNYGIQGIMLDEDSHAGNWLEMPTDCASG